MTTVREFSRCGPCIVLGKLVKETASFYVFEENYGGAPVRSKIRKRTDARYSPAHIEPCPSCRDHPRTQYPDGYMD
jgi:hypothetical protein